MEIKLQGYELLEAISDYLSTKKGLTGFSIDYMDYVEMTAIRAINDDKGMPTSKTKRVTYHPEELSIELFIEKAVPAKPQPFKVKKTKSKAERRRKK